MKRIINNLSEEQLSTNKYTKIRDYRYDYKPDPKSGMHFVVPNDLESCKKAINVLIDLFSQKIGKCQSQTITSILDCLIKELLAVHKENAPSIIGGSYKRKGKGNYLKYIIAKREYFLLKS